VKIIVWQFRKFGVSSSRFGSAAWNIAVKTFFNVFYILITFFNVFNVFFIFQTFFILKNIGKV